MSFNRDQDQDRTSFEISLQNAEQRSASGSHDILAVAVRQAKVQLGDSFIFHGKFSDPICSISIFKASPFGATKVCSIVSDDDKGWIKVWLETRMGQKELYKTIYVPRDDTIALRVESLVRHIVWCCQKYNMDEPAAQVYTMQERLGEQKRTLDQEQTQKRPKWNMADISPYREQRQKRPKWIMPDISPYSYGKYDDW